jgi:hypothetical protein
MNIRRPRHSSSKTTQPDLRSSYWLELRSFALQSQAIWLLKRRSRRRRVETPIRHREKRLRSDAFSKWWPGKQY